MKKILQKLSEFVTVKKMLIVSCLLYIGSMLPNWLLAFIARPAGDDYGYSAASHQVWLQTHSLLEVVKTGVETTRNMCNVWNGDWFSVFIFTFYNGTGCCYSGGNCYVNAVFKYLLYRIAFYVTDLVLS